MSHKLGWVLRIALTVFGISLLVGAAWGGVTGQETTASASSDIGDSSVDGDSASAKLVVRYPVNSTTMGERTAIAPADVSNVSAPKQSERSDLWTVRLSLTEAGSENFTAALQETEFLDNSISCPSSAVRTASRNQAGWCLLTVVNGDVVGTFSMDQRLAAAIQNGEFDGRMPLVVKNESEALAFTEAFGDEPEQSTATTVGSTQAPTTNVTPTSVATTAESGSPGFGPGVAALAVLGLTIAARAVTER